MGDVVLIEPSRETDSELTLGRRAASLKIGFVPDRDAGAMGNGHGVRLRADFRANRSSGHHSREAAREPGLRCSSVDMLITMSAGVKTFSTTLRNAFRGECHFALVETCQTNFTGPTERGLLTIGECGRQLLGFSFKPQSWPLGHAAKSGCILAKHFPYFSWFLRNWPREPRQLTRRRNPSSHHLRTRMCIRSERELLQPG